MGSFLNYLQSTMLIERLTGVSVYAMLLAYFYNRIKHVKHNEYISKYLNFYLFFLCVLSFFYVPGTSSDLYRWRNISYSWSNMNFGAFWNYFVLPSRTPIGYLLIYFCQKTGIDGLLPMVCCLGFYNNIFYILKCESKRENRKANSIAVALLFFMSFGTFLEVISGIRCMLAFSIVLRLVYGEMYLEKSILRSIPFYIIAVLLHSATILLIAIRFLCLLFEKKHKKIIMIINILSVIGFIVFALRYGNEFIDEAFGKADYYTSQNIYSYTWEYIMVSIGLCVLISVIIKFRNRYPDFYSRVKPSLRLIFVIFAMEIVFFRTYVIFHRFFTASAIISLPILISFLSCEDEENFAKSRSLIVLLSMIILFIACTRGNLCGYKFFLLN